MLVEGKQQWLFDETGRRYLDVSDLLCVCLSPNQFFCHLPRCCTAQRAACLLCSRAQLIA